ncbi:MAG: hypothetical protein AB1649_19995, partial [Chloroflexota bacterium]
LVAEEVNLDSVSASGHGWDNIYTADAGTVNIFTSTCEPQAAAQHEDEGQGSPWYIIIEQPEDQLPAELLEGNIFASALKLIFVGENVPENVSIDLAFPIPEGMQDAKLAVLFWDGAGWVTVPGGNVKDGYFVITVSQPGFYVLVSQE